MPKAWEVLKSAEHTNREGYANDQRRHARSLTSGGLGQHGLLFGNEQASGSGVGKSFTQHD